MLAAQRAGVFQLRYRARCCFLNTTRCGCNVALGELYKLRVDGSQAARI
jgi:hypothetical protein